MICDVDAVGIGEISRLFLIPKDLISSLNLSQSYLSLGFSPHKSNWNKPREIGLPSNELYAPIYLVLIISTSNSLTYFAISSSLLLFKISVIILFLFFDNSIEDSTAA